ncbi:hypothetical protein VNO77_05461 [Canavalia gladiata]|uniref:Uncharacterized protein n=1 Tax=Canavalia gladiata TaxID=3824 RepID=A0AAN9N3L4_CANGL
MERRKHLQDSYTLLLLHLSCPEEFSFANASSGAKFLSKSTISAIGIPILFRRTKEGPWHNIDVEELIFVLNWTHFGIAKNGIFNCEIGRFCILDRVLAYLYLSLRNQLLSVPKLVFSSSLSFAFNSLHQFICPQTDRFHYSNHFKVSSFIISHSNLGFGYSETPIPTKGIDEFRVTHLASC